MRTKIILCLLVAIAFWACKKSNDVQSSASIAGSWKFIKAYNVTIAGTQRTNADPAKPVIWNFNSTSYSITTTGQLTKSGTYMLLDKYQYHPGYYVADVLKLDSVIVGTYSVHRGNPDTLLISDINPGPDNGFGATYLRVK